MSEAPRLDAPEPESPGSRRQWYALAGALIAVLVFDHLRIVPYLRTAAFHMDAWEMVARAYDPRGMLAGQADDIRHWIRVRPVFQLAVPLWVKLRGLDGPGLALALWGAVLAVQLLGVRFLRTLGYGLPTAALASFLVLMSCGVLRTTYAHQYNDVTFSHFFTLLMLTAALRGRSLAVTLPLLVLATLSHECGVMGGPLLVLCDAFRDGTPAARRRLATPERFVPLALCVAYAAFRFLKTPPTEHTLSGFQALAKNADVLLSSTTRVLFTDFRSLFFLGMGIALYRSGQLRIREYLPSWLFAGAWLLTAYLPFLTNQAYQSSTYLNLALLVPAAAVLDPVCRWIFSPSRQGSWQIALPVITVLALNHWNLQEDLSAYGRFVGPALAAVSSRLPPGHERVDVWLIEDEGGNKAFGRTIIQDAFDMYRPDESIAFNLTIADREVRVHPIDPDSIRYARPRSDDVVFRMLAGGPESSSLWRLPVDGGAPELVHASGADGQARPAPLAPEPLPTGAVGEIVGRFWDGYGARTQTHAGLKASEALLDEATKQAHPPWLRAMQAVFPDLPLPPNGIPVEPRPIRAG